LQAFKGMAMWRFKRSKAKEIWDEEIQWPIGDIEAAHKIREICRAALESAEKVGGFARRPDIAMKISDDLLRDSSVRQIVDLCMKAEDMRTARILLRAIQAASIREEVMKDYPVLSQ